MLEVGAQLRYFQLFWPLTNLALNWEEAENSSLLRQKKNKDGLSETMIKFLPLECLAVSHRIPRKIENVVYRLQISAFVQEMFKLEKCVKYANSTTLRMEKINMDYKRRTWKFEAKPFKMRKTWRSSFKHLTFDKYSTALGST